MRGRGTVEKLCKNFKKHRSALAKRESTIHVEELVTNSKMNRCISSNPQILLPSRRLKISSSNRGRNPHPSYSPHRSSWLMSTQPSTAFNTDGYSTRSLDESATASSARDHSRKISYSSSSLESITQEKHYKIFHTRSRKNRPPMAARKDGHGDRNSLMLSNSVSTGTYPSGYSYSLDQYSQDASETLGVNADRNIMTVGKNIMTNITSV